MPTLSLCIIARNEEHNLKRLLESIWPCSGIYDEIIVVDTGSTDGTKSVALHYGAKVFDFKWIDDFAAARNFSFCKASSDFLMWLDADDVILPKDRDRLLQLKPTLGPIDAYLMPYDYAQDEHGKCTVQVYRHRIVRKGIAKWVYPIHECMQLKHGHSVQTEWITVTHKRSPCDSLRDKGRNLNILRRAVVNAPQDKRLQYYYAKELVTEGLLRDGVEALQRYLGDTQSGDWHENRVNAYWYLAIAQKALGDDAGAIKACGEAITLDPRFAEPMVLVGQIHYDKEEWAKAIPWFEMASRLKVPDSAGQIILENYTWVPHDRLCMCYSKVGRVQDAYDANEKAIAFKPTEPRLLGNRECLRNILFPGRHMERPCRLSLGSGGKFTSGYRNSDMFPGPGIHEVFDQGAIPYPDSSIHAIHSEHALEHSASHSAAERTLAEWSRVLRHGGSLHLKVPDLEACCEALVRSEDRDKLPGERFAPREWYKYTIYGIQRSLGAEPPEGQFHRTGFTRGMLSRLMLANGFKVDSMAQYDGYGTPSIELRATMVGKAPRVVWMIPGPIDANNASLRIRCLNLHEWFGRNGVESRLVEYKQHGDPFSLVRGADVVVFLGIGEQEFELSQRLRRSGVSVVQEHCEDLEGLPFQSECFGSASVISCCSTVLADKAQRHGRTICLPDAYEESKHWHAYGPHGVDGKLRVTWCGMGGNAINAESIRPIIEGLGMELRIISEWDSADLRWNKDTWLLDLSDSDIIISPQRHWLQPAKSNTKVTQAMALGIPVLGSPIQSYKEAIRHGENGFICSTPEEWKRDLMACQEQQTRERIGRAAKADVTKSYSIDAVGRRWKELIEGLAKENCQPPKCDIIVPTFNNLELLQECIKSIKACTDGNYNIIVVNSGTDGTAAWLGTQQDIIAINAPPRLHFSAAINAGLRCSKERFVCLLNDDTIVSIGWLDALMREALKPGLGAVNPFSNCDLGWLHDETIEIEGIPLVPSMTLDAVRPIISKLYELGHQKVVTEREWLPFFCTLIPREIIDSVGFLDEGFKSGCEDVEYSRRIKAAGLRMVTTFDSVVFHFGGATRKKAEATDHAQHHAEDRENHALLARGRGDPKAKKLVIYTGPAWERWSPLSVDAGGIGGSETCVVHVARQFAQRGWEVIVFGDCAGLEGTYDGVQYRHHGRFGEFLRLGEIDLFISSRRPEVFSMGIRAKKKVCWIHDIWLSADPKANIHADKVDEFWCLSPWHKQFFCAHHGIPPLKVWVTRNGVDLNRFRGPTLMESGRMLYTSSPDRGLDVLLQCFPRIREKVPNASLHVFYGFDNWEKAVLSRNNPEEKRLMGEIKVGLNQPGVHYHGRVGQKQLADEFLRSELWAYPTGFTETFCISAIEAMAAGLPVITSRLAALETTVGDAGILLHGDPHSEAYQDEFVARCVGVLTDPKEWLALSNSSLERASHCGWDSVVDEWVRHLA